MTGSQNNREQGETGGVFEERSITLIKINVF